MHGWLSLSFVLSQFFLMTKNDVAIFVPRFTWFLGRFTISEKIAHCMHASEIVADGCTTFEELPTAP